MLSSGRGGRRAYMLSHFVIRWSRGSELMYDFEVENGVVRTYVGEWMMLVDGRVQVPVPVPVPLDSD